MIEEPDPNSLPDIHAACIELNLALSDLEQEFIQERYTQQAIDFMEKNYNEN